MAVRIYDIAKKLGLAPKIVIAKAKELEIPGATLPSSSLQDEAARVLEQHLDGSRDVAYSAPTDLAGPEVPVAQSTGEDAETKSKLDTLEAYRAAFWPPAYGHDSHVLLTLAESYMAVSRFDEALRLLVKVIGAAPANAVAYHRIGEVYWNVSRFEEAIESFAHAEDLDPSSNLVTDAIDQIVQGPLNGARGIEALLKMTAKYPRNPGLRYSLAWACRLDNRLTEAAEHFRHLLSAHLPNDEWRADIEFELSGVLEDKGELMAAVELVEKALPRLGTHWNRHEVEEGLADDYLALGRFEDALKIFLGWLESASPAVGLTGERGAPHAPGDLRTYEVVKKALIKILDAAEVSGGESDLVGRVGSGVLGKVQLALSRCYEETGDSSEV